MVFRDDTLRLPPLPFWGICRIILALQASWRSGLRMARGKWLVSSVFNLLLLSYPTCHCRAQSGLSSEHSFLPLCSISLQCLERVKENCVAGYRSSRNTSILGDQCFECHLVYFLLSAFQCPVHLGRGIPKNPFIVFLDIIPPSDSFLPRDLMTLKLSVPWGHCASVSSHIPASLTSFLLFLFLCLQKDHLTV